MDEDFQKRFNMAACKCCGYASYYPMCYSCFQDVVDSFAKLDIIVTRTMLGYCPIASKALKADMNKYDIRMRNE